MPSIYVSHVADQLPAHAPAEGLIYPLLRREDGVWLGARVVTGSFAGYARNGDTLSGDTNGALPTIDGVALGVGDVFLLNQGISARDNGLYAISDLGNSSAPWLANRVPEFDSQADAVPGTFVWVQQGMSGAGKRFTLSNSTPPDINSDDVNFQENDEAVFHWAFAVPQPTETTNLAERRKNRLICAVLKALGFVVDANNASYGGPFDFYHLADNLPVDPFASTVFDLATLPDLSGTPANLEVLDPIGGTLKLSAAATKDIKAGAPVKVHQFVFANAGGHTPGRFDLGVSGQSTSPGFTAKITLEPDLKSEFPSGTLPVLTFDQLGVAGALRCNTVEVIASNKMPGSATTIAADVRHDRLSVDVATLICTEPDDDPKLAIEVFPAISFQPEPDLPVTVTLSNEGLCLRLQPRVFAGDTLPPRVTVHRFKPCVRVTIRGPVIHADASATGALEALRLLEPAERKFEDTVEQINDFLVYSFEVCLPSQRVPDIGLSELVALESIGLEVPSWPDSFPRLDKVVVPDFLLRLAMPSLGLRVPDYEVNPLEIDLRSFGLPFPDLLSNLGLPDITAPNWPRWSEVLRFRRFDGVLLDQINITRMSIDGLTLNVTFAEIPVEAKLEIHLPDKIKWDEFDVQFPEVSIPSLTEFELGLETPDVGFDLKVSIPNGPIALAQPELWTIQLKKPAGPKLSLKITEVNVSGFDVQFKVANLPAFDSTVDKLLVKWQFKCDPPDLNLPVPKIVLAERIPEMRLPKIDVSIDARLLKLRAFKAGIEFGVFGILDVSSDFKTLTLDIPPINGKFPVLQLFDADVTFDVSLDVSLSLSKCFLSDLLGDLGSVDFRFSVPQLAKLPDFNVKPPNFDLSTLAPRFTIPEILAAFGSLATPIIPLELVVRVPHPTKPKLEWDELKLVLGMKFDLGNLRLAENRIYFFLPQKRSSDPLSNLAPRQVMDFDIFTLTFPNRPEPLGIPTLENHDGYLDLTSREFVIDLKYKGGEEPTPPPRIHAFFPGGMDPTAARLGREGVENLGKEHVDYGKYRQEYAKRFDLELDEVDPKLWPNTGPDRLMFRFNSNGLTFAANLGKTEVEIDSSGFLDDGGSDGNSSGLIKPFKCQPQEKQRELRSRVVIIDNELKEAGVYAKTEVPGVENLMAEVSVVLRQRQKGTLPEVLASMELERADEAPLAEFSIKLLELSLDRLELGLIWRMQEKDWDYSIIADGTIGFTGAAALVPDLEGLRVPSIQVVGLDLRRMNLRQLRVPINLVKPVRFEILDGMFGVELGDLEIGWEFDGKIPKPRLLACELAKLTFKNPGALEVSVSVGGLHIEFDDDLKAHVKLPSSLGIEVALGTSAKFAGRVGWVETDVERYLFASGKLMLEGMPEVRGLLKFGTGLKHNGRPEINLVLYGEMDLDEQLFSGAVVKSLGLGVGLNNRLAALPPTPSADAILRRIDLVKPGELEGWQFVREGGFYMSVIGSVTLASNLGEPDVLNAYVAALVVSIDTNFDLVAAGKLWLSCSVKGQKDNPNNPAFVGAMVLSPRQRKLEVVLESRKNAYVEQNDLIKKLLDKGFVRFAFRMTPQLVDFHLAEVSYRDQMFGVDMEFRGEYRFAIFKRAVLLKNELSATGSISRSLSGGAGGFDLDGQAYLRMGYGGLLSDRGAMAYAFIDAGIRFRVSAWIEIGFSISFKICGKRYSKSWTIVFRTRVPQLELTLRGHVAIADRGGFGGFDLLVGINVPICGYRLNVTVGWAVNAELYQEVRAQVAAFEAELEAAVNALDDESISFTRRQIDKHDPAQVPALPGVHILSVGVGAGINARLRGIEIHTDATKVETASTVPESWLFYSREVGDKSTALLVPAADGRWLTPMLATIQEVIVKTGAIFSTKETNYAGSLTDISARDLNVSSNSGNGQGSTFDVAISDTGEVTLRVARFGEGYSVDDELKILGTDLPGGATPDDDVHLRVATVGRIASFATYTGQSYPEGKVRLVGLRGAPKLAELNNNAWIIKASDSGFITLDISATTIDAGEYPGLLGGVWQIDESETVSGLSPGDHDTVPYLNEVERAVLRIDEWRPAELSGSTLTMSFQHKFPPSGKRVLLRPNGGTVVDNGRPEVTVLAIPETDQQLRLVDFSIDNGPKDYQFAPAIEIAPPWSAHNRLAALREYMRDELVPEIRPAERAGIDKYKYLDYVGAAAAWAETAAKADDGEIASTSDSYAVVFDERYTSGDPRFSPADAPDEPGVLSTRFRQIDDVEAVGVDSVLESARRFEEASRSVARQYLHGAFDLDDQEAIRQARAQATQLLVHRLSEPRGPESNDRLEAPAVEFNVDAQHEVVYGWFCTSQTTVWEKVIAAIGANGRNDVLFVRRAGSAAIPVTVAIPDNKASKKENEPIPLPIRQDFVIDDASEVHERGRVIVQLPIRYEDEVLRRRSQDVGRLQVYRRIGDGPEGLVFDQLRPEIPQLDKRQVYNHSRQQFVDYPAAAKDTKDTEIKGTFDPLNNRLSIASEYTDLLPKPSQVAKATDPLESMKCRIGASNFSVTDVARDDRNIHLTLAGEDNLTPGELTFLLTAEGLIVPRPVLISDEFKVTDRQFDSAKLRAAIGSERAPLVRYSLRLLAEDDPGGANPKDLIPWPTPVPLYIPTRKEPLPNLALAVPISSLLQNSARGVTFQLVDLSEETPKLAERNGRPLSAKEFEFWLDGDILRQSGFYAGEAADPTSPRERDGERVTLAAVDATNGLESTAGKVQVELERVPSTTYFKLKDTPLAPGAAFRALFRLKGDTSVRSLRRLPILLVREFPKMWDSAVRYRVIDTAEIIPEADALSVAKGEAKPLLVDFSADDRYEAGRAAIRSVWPSLSLLDGGVELQFRDFDDSSMRSRTLVEVLEADEFSQSQSDFRDDTFWTPRPPDRVERYVSRVVATGVPPDDAKLKAVYLWQRQGGKIDVVRRLEKARDELLACDNGWECYAKAVRNVQTALLSFEKSPLNLNSVATRQLIELLRLTLRAVVVGNKVGANAADKIEDARTTNQSLLELLTRIEQSRAETVSDTDANDVAFLDRDTARKLAGIARRRIAIADEALALQRIDAIPQAASMRQQDKALARLDYWDGLLADARSLAAENPLPMAESIVSRFLPQPDDKDLPRNHEAAELCIALITRLVTKIGELELEKVVPRAAGLSELLHKLNEETRDKQSNTPAGLLKRPHHELTTTRREDGEIIARAVPLRELLPPRARQAKLGEVPQEPDERLDRLGIRAGHVATLFANGNVAIWTTRGNSVQNDGMERVQYFATPATTVSNVSAFELGEVAEGPRLLIAATFNGTADVQLWDAGEAKMLRKYGGSTGAALATTPRGLEVAVVHGATILLETTEPTEPQHQAKRRLSQEVLDRLRQFHSMPESTITKLQPLKDRDFPDEQSFRDAIAEALTEEERRQHGQSIVNQARDPLPFKTPLAFRVGVDSTAFAGPVAYHDEIQVVAAARGNEILFWRDMGRPANETPFLTFKLQDTKAATHIQPVTLPKGAGFVIVSNDPDKGLFFVNPFGRQLDPSLLPHKQPQPTVVESTLTSVTQLAVDRRNLTATVVSDGKVYTYDLLQVEGRVDSPDAGNVAVLHGRHEGQDQSYLALPEEGGVRIMRPSDATPQQTLPKPKGLGDDADPGAFVALASALQTARTATAAGDPLSLFHLWERMGFAVDIAAQDKTTRLLTLKELRNQIDAAIRRMENYKTGYSIYVVEGEEPDAEFRDDRVGFSHVSLAVVPNEFLAACLQPNFESLKAWLNNRSIKLAQEVLETDSLEEKARKEQENQRELEYIVHMTQLVGVPEPSRYGTVVGNTDPPPVVPRGGKLRLQPRSDRFVRVPASAGFSHWSWTLPDRKGHRMLVAARRVSRYEPLLRWSLNLHSRFDLAEEVPLKRVGSNATVHTVASPVSKVAVTLNSELEPPTGWQPLRIEFVEGPGTGQRREILSIDASTLKLDEGDPLLVEPVANQSKCRVMDAAPGWRLVVIDAIHDPARGEGAKPLMVYQYPHSRKPRFSYQIPLDGMRATYNQISRVRTGYDGIEAAFRYFLPDRIDNPEAATLEGLLSEIVSSEDIPALPPRTVTNVAGGAEPDVRLFRHERMVSLPGLPFFYRYLLDVRSAYQSRLLEWDRASAAQRLPDDENASPFAQRLPASLGLNEMTLSPLVLTGNLPTDQPTESTMVRLFTDGEFEGDLRLRVRPTSGDDWIERSVTNWRAGVLSVDPEFADQPAEGWEYELEAANAFEAVLYLSANRDHLTREEARSEPMKVEVNDVDARDLPDFFMDYSLFRNQQEGDGSIPSIGDLFSVIGSIRMPWSPNFEIPKTFPADAKKKPFLSVASGVKLVNVSGGGSPTESGQETSVAIERVTINGSPYWRLRFWIANEPGQAILAKENVYIQAIRDGKLTRAVKCAMPE